jgi:Ca2+-binding RTX toxin-like protein
LSGGDGDDRLHVQGNDALLDGGAGFDQVIVIDTAGVTITMGSGIESATGNSGNDSIDGSLLSTALTLDGAGGIDILRGGSDIDVINGGLGSDTLFGNSGNDQLFGGDGDDSLYGGAGDDQFTTGIGSDVFFIESASGNDSVLDFIDGLDLFDFSEHGLVASMADLTITDSGSDALVTFDGGQITVFGAVGFIDDADFLFA